MSAFEDLDLQQRMLLTFEVEEFLYREANLLDERRLDVHMDVFAFQEERELPGLDLSLDFQQTPLNLPALIRGKQSNPLEHPRVGERSPYVVLEESTVEGDRFGE